MKPYELQYAIERHDNDRVKQGIRSMQYGGGANVKNYLPGKTTLLICAVKCNNYQAAELLLSEGGYDLNNMKDGRNCTALDYALDKKDPKMIKILIKHYARTDLDEVLYKNDISKMQQALSSRKYFYTNAMSENVIYTHALNQAISSKKLEMVELLMSNGVQITLLDQFILINIIRNKWNDILKQALQEDGINVNQKLDDKYLLGIAIEEQNVEAIELLLKHEADPNLIIPDQTKTSKEDLQEYNSGRGSISDAIFGSRAKPSPLIALVENKDAKQCIIIFNLLFQAGLKLGKENLCQYLYKALDKENIEIVKYLISKGAKLDDRSIQSLLFKYLWKSDERYHSHDQSREYNDDLLELILQHDIDPLLTCSGNSIINGLIYKKDSNNEYSIRNFNRTLFNLCLAKEVDINHQNNEGDTILSIAAKLGNLELFNFLIENGADINAINKNGISILNAAVNQIGYLQNEEEQKIDKKKKEIQEKYRYLQYEKVSQEEKRCREEFNKQYEEDLEKKYKTENSLFKPSRHDMREEVAWKKYVQPYRNNIEKKCLEEQQQEIEQMKTVQVEHSRVQLSNYKKIIYILLAKQVNLHLKLISEQEEQYSYRRDTTLYEDSNLLAWSVEHDQEMMNFILTHYTDFEQYKPKAMQTAISQHNLLTLEKIWSDSLSGDAYLVCLETALSINDKNIVKFLRSKNLECLETFNEKYAEHYKNILTLLAKNFDDHYYCEILLSLIRKQIPLYINNASISRRSYETRRLYDDSFRNNSIAINLLSWSIKCNVSPTMFLTQFILQHYHDIKPYRREAIEAAISANQGEHKFDKVELIKQLWHDEQVSDESYLSFIDLAVSGKNTPILEFLLTKEKYFLSSIENIKASKHTGIMSNLIMRLDNHGIYRKVLFMLFNKQFYLDIERGSLKFSNSLSWSVEHDYEIMQYILEYYSELDKYKIEAVKTAISLDHIGYAKELWKNTQFDNQQMSEFLKLAIEEEKVKCAEFLLSKGANRFGIRFDYDICNEEIISLLENAPTLNEVKEIQNITVVKLLLSQIQQIKNLGPDILTHIFKNAFDITLVSINTIRNILGYKFDSENKEDIITKYFLNSDEQLAYRMLPIEQEYAKGKGNFLSHKKLKTQEEKDNEREFDRTRFDRIGRTDIKPPSSRYRQINFTRNNYSDESEDDLHYNSGNYMEDDYESGGYTGYYSEESIDWDSDRENEWMDNHRD